MSTRSAHNWKTNPGSLDTTHSQQTYPARNGYGIPDLPPAPLSAIPTWLAPYRTRIRSDQPISDGAIHFFLDDYRFESCWSHPGKALRYLDAFNTVLSPDFSLYANMPVAVQLYNTYRSRWLGCYWHSLGKTVIPTVSWAGEPSFDFAFLGLPRRSLVALAATGLQQPLNYYAFANGFKTMLDVLEPSAVLVYGQLNPELADLTTVYSYPTTWDNIRSARHYGRTRQQRTLQKLPL